MNHPILPLVADLIIEIGQIDKKSIGKETKDRLEKTIKKKRDYLKSLLKEPAYRFNDQFIIEKEGK